MTETLETPQASKADNFQSNLLQTAKGSGFLVAGRFFAFGGRFAIVFLLARLLGAEQYGLYNLALSAALVTASLSALGLDRAMVRYIAIQTINDDQDSVWGTLQVGVGISVLVSTAAGAVLFWQAPNISQTIFGEPQLTSLLQLLGIVVPFLTLSNVLAGAVRGFKRMDYSALAEDFIQLLVRMILIGVLALIRLDVFVVAIIFGISDVSATVALIYFLNKEFSFRRPLRRAKYNLREIASFAMPFWIAGLLRQFKNNLQTILLGTLSTVTSVGIFAIAGRVTSLSHAIQLSLATSVNPIIAQISAKEDWKQLGRLYTATTRWTLTVNLPFFLLLVLYPDSLLSFFGKSFVSGALALSVFAIEELINAATGVCGAIVDMTGHNRMKLANSVIRISILIGANFLLIPRWDFLGAAISVALATTVVNLLRVLQIWYWYRLQPIDLSFAKPIAAALAAAVASQLLTRVMPAGEIESFGATLILVMHASLVLVTFAVALVLLGLPEEERTVLARAIRRLSSLAQQVRTVRQR